MDIPSRTMAATDIKKVQIAKTLAELVNILDTVIARGYAILERLEILPSIEDESEYSRGIRELKALIHNQIDDLKAIGKTIQHNFLWSDTLMNIPNYDMFEYLHKPTKVQQVLSVYEPDLGSALYCVLEWKSNILTGLAENFEQNIDSNDKSNLRVKEIVSIDTELLKSQGAKIRFQKTLEEAKKNNKIKFQDIHLSNPAERKKYLSRAKKRLKELENARKKLAKLIREHYEPHQII